MANGKNGKATWIAIVGVIILILGYFATFGKDILSTSDKIYYPKASGVALETRVGACEESLKELHAKQDVIMESQIRSETKLDIILKEVDHE